MQLFTKFLSPILLLVCTSILSVSATTILPMGDSITGGGAAFSNYREFLVPALRQEKLDVKFIGPLADKTSAHAGYGGKNTHFLAESATKIYTEYPADIVLIHSGHNSFSKDKPVGGIVKDTQNIITNIRKVNPNVSFLLAQSITSGKLPKYGYIPELNQRLAALAKALDQKQSPVILVDQATGFDWKADTVSDKVHPNPQGAKKMADKWLTALLPILAKPEKAFLLPQPSKCDEHYAKRMALFEKINPTAERNGVVLLGDSLTEAFPVQKIPVDWKLTARGISGDCVGGWKYRGLADRLDISCHQLKPKTVFILIGINDTINYSELLNWEKQLNSANHDQLIEGYKQIITEIHAKNPATSIHLCSVLPTGTQRGLDKYNATINELNTKIKALCESSAVASYLDLHASFLKEGNTHMKPELSTDGIHLTAAGYSLWINALAEMMNK